MKSTALRNSLSTLALMVTCLCAWLPTTMLRGQTEDSDVTAKTVLQENLYTSARATGMGGALGPVADGMDAAYYNPAAIGGIHLDKKRSQDVARFLGFPYMGAEVGENSVTLYNQFLNTTEATTNPVVTQAVLGANSGDRQYARFSMVPSLNISRFMVGYIYDNQVAALPLADENLGLIRVHQRSQSGPVFGFSATDPEGRLYIGGSAAALTRKELDGDLSFGDIVDLSKRNEAMAANSTTYTGTTSNAGILWRISKTGNPTLSLVSRNVGDTVYSGSGGSSYTVEENMALGFAVSPKLGKWGYFSWSFEADQLLDPETTIEKKLKSGLELTFGDYFGWASGAGIRLGGNASGASAGLHANIGLIGFQASTYSEDLGVDNNRILERRYIGIVSINVAH